jgi:hypothetical protein
MGLEEPTDDIGTVLTKGAVKLGKAQRQRDVVGKSVHINTYVFKYDTFFSLMY